jgi:hypothetical protein
VERALERLECTAIEDSYTIQILVIEALRLGRNVIEFNYVKAVLLWSRTKEFPQPVGLLYQVPYRDLSHSVSV